jgi:transglutaminase-like putative cysteine protease
MKLQLTPPRTPRTGGQAPDPPTSIAARVAALAVAATALACLSASGGLRGELVSFAVVATALVELLNERRSARTEAVLRTYVLPLALLVCVGPAIPALLSAQGDPDLVREAGARLAAGALVVLPLAGASRRDLLTRLALAAATAGLAASGAADEVVLPGLLFAVAAAALLALLERDRLAAHAAASSPTPPPDLPLRAGLVPGVALLLVVGLIAAVLTRDVELTPRAPGGGPAAPGGQGNDRLEADSGFMDLRQRGPLPQTPIAQVATAEPLLWRSTVLTEYSGRYWRAAATTESASEPAGVGRSRTDQVRLLDRSARLLLSPGRPTTLEPLVGRPVGHGGAWRMPLGPYSVTSVGNSFDPGDPTELLAGASDENTLQLPEVPGRVLDLASRLTEGAPTRAAAVDAVVRYLRENYTYRLDSAVPAANDDAVDDFLFETREGFCEQFASAAAVLLRAAGVPARLVVGYAVGEPNAEGRLLRGDDAHAWIEVEFDERGWVDVDPTAGAREVSEEGSAWRAWLSRHGFGALALSLLGLALGVGLGLAAVLVRRRRREAGLDPLDRALRVLDRRLGADRRRPEETLREFAERIGCDPREASALGVAERARYAPSAPQGGERRAAAAVLAARRRRQRAARRTDRQAPCPPGSRRRDGGR